jgi:protein-disulfide isomerase
VQTGRVFWRIVPFELGFRNSDESVRAGQCGAEQGLFWEMHDALYAHQEEWIGERRPKDELAEVAQGAGLDVQAYLECYDDDPGEDRTEQNNDAADDDGVRATPTFFINGFMVQGALPFEAFEALLMERASGG